MTRLLSTDDRTLLMMPLRSKRLRMVVTVAKLRLTVLAMSETVGSFRLLTA